jgi:ferredoxin-NADP reductase
MSTFQVRVARRTHEAEDICSYELVRVDGAPLPSFEAGAPVDVHLPNNLVRQYSLCNAPGETHRYLIGVLRDAGSRAMHDDIDTGSILQISEPKNHFPLVAAGRTLLMAGGIGVTPILAMAEALAARGAASEMHYCARAPERAAFRERIGASGFADLVHFTTTAATPARSWTSRRCSRRRRRTRTSTCAARKASSTTYWTPRRRRAGLRRSGTSSISAPPRSIPAVIGRLT